MIFETFRIALNGLRTNKLRTFLSMLGIIIGVGAVIAIVSIGSSAREEVTAQISSLGSDLLWVTPGFTAGRATRMESDPRENFTLDIIQYIDDYSPGVTNVVPEVSGSVQLRRGDNTLNSTAVGTSQNFTVVNIYYPERGRFIDQDDLDQSRNSIVLGSNVATELFSDTDPIGQRIRLNYQGRNINFTVVGVMEQKGQGVMGNLDRRVYIPVTTFTNKLSRQNFVDLYYAQFSPGFSSQEARNQIDYFFFQHLGDENLYNIMSQDQILGVLDQVTGTLSLMLGGIAGISLLVGGIGIMNIMLVSVTERTREIGIRKALGAKKRNILGQFLLESLALSSIGGFIGIGLGYAGTYLVTRIGNWPLVLSPVAVMLAFGFSLAIGLFFGIYPAVKAARLDPVDSLSYE
ncbi:ABC transporter permease [Halanaerobiaceae bacterium Z-7014]|uniref:ABC transporter permease n=1 Tax=Halonatronomonas betaini TaxID=2778430 RepID=A0A931ATV3_9FIRM|nr:ABC transporter permease [Halonatronomonas betaini]MBF8437811.1 ABC transporter permease [Halonatronomonas betaini]